MMTTKAIKPFKGVPDGAVHALTFEPGDVVEGDLARVAIQEGWAEEQRDDDESVEDEAPTQDATSEDEEGSIDTKTPSEDDEAAVTEDDLDALRERAEALGIDVDGRWGAKRLEQEIAKVA